MRALLAALLLLFASAAARADRLHLRGGGVLEADSWWIDGDDLHVETEGGETTIPRSLLVRVETTSPSPARPRKSAAATGPVVEKRDLEEVGRLLEEGGAALEAREFDTASIRFHRALDLAPDLTRARVGYAVAESALGRDPSALAAVLDGLVRDPSSADLHEILGDLKNREERVEDALTAWREAFRLSPNDRRREKILKAERELQAGRDFAFAAAAHFNLRYDGDADPDLAAEVLDFLEDRYGELTSTWRFAPQQPITAILYAEREFRDVTLADTDVAGLFDGKIRVPIGGLRRLDDRARRVLSHELTHAIVHAKSRGTCPRWLHEGLAQMAEPRPSTRADAAKVRDALSSGDLVAWSSGDFSYPAALSFARYLESERGFDALVRLVGDLGEGRTVDDSLVAEFGDDFDTLVRRWAARVKEGGAR